MRLLIGIVLFTMFMGLALYVRWLEGKKYLVDDEVLPPPDRSVKRGAQVADEMSRYASRVGRQG